MTNRNFNMANKTARSARTFVDFRRPVLEPLVGGCNRHSSCTSEGAHLPHCPRLAADLERWKANRAAWYAAGGYNGHRR